MKAPSLLPSPALAEIDAHFRAISSLQEIASGYMNVALGFHFALFRAGGWYNISTSTTSVFICDNILRERKEKNLVPKFGSGTFLSDPKIFAVSDITHAELSRFATTIALPIYLIG